VVLLLTRSLALHLAQRTGWVYPPESLRWRRRYRPLGSPEIVPVLSRALSDAEPLVRVHAAGALGRLASAEAWSALSDRRRLEADASVLEEVLAAMDA
jgi:HEAT repeat protein